MDKKTLDMLSARLGGNGPLISIKELRISELGGAGTTSVYRYVKEGKLPSPIKIGARSVFDRDVVRAAVRPRDNLVNLEQVRSVVGCDPMELVARGLLTKPAQRLEDGPWWEWGDVLDRLKQEADNARTAGDAA